MERPKAKLLVVDDEEALREGLGAYLDLEGYAVDTAESAAEAAALGVGHYDLVLLDIMMDGISGTEFAAKLKENPDTADIPIIFLTAKDSDDDMVSGLKLGADDYISKPYSVRNVVARIEAVLRRTSGRAGRQGVVCDRGRLLCTIDGQTVKMPRKEFEILAMLLENPGRIFSREEIMKAVWPENTVVVDRTVDVHVTRIRTKLGPYGKSIITRSGYGYGWQS